MRIHTFHTRHLIRASLERVFDFFSRAENLQELTPSSLHFHILTPLPIEMRKGVIIEYKLRLLGIPIRWQSEITVWDPGVRFADVQRKGPYLLWEHEHLFQEVDDGTLMEDTLRYAVPGWILEPLVHRLFVKPQIEKIFEFRGEAIDRLLHSL